MARYRDDEDDENHGRDMGYRTPGEWEKDEMDLLEELRHAGKEREADELKHWVKKRRMTARKGTRKKKRGKRKSQRANIPTLAQVSSGIKNQYPPYPYPVAEIAERQTRSPYRIVRNIRDVRLQKGRTPKSMKANVPGASKLVGAMDRAKKASGVKKLRF